MKMTRYVILSALLSLVSGSRDGLAAAEYRILSRSEAALLAGRPFPLEADPETLPPKLQEELLERASPQLTDFSRGSIDLMFSELARDPNARMRKAGGACGTRANYIQRWFQQQKSAQTGLLYIGCPLKPGKRGRMIGAGKLAVTDRVTGRTYTYINYHYANVVEVVTKEGRGFEVLDVQFEDGPVTLSQYLAEVSRNQRLRPALMGQPQDVSTCTWEIRVPGVPLQQTLAL